MNEMSIARIAGTDGLTVLLAAGLGQRHGMRVSSGRSAGAAHYVEQACLRSAAGGWSGNAVTFTGIPVAVRVRKPADGDVPGAPPRGAPV